MSGITDCYQPIERKLRLTRRCPEILTEFRNPVAVITKNQLVTRDLDLYTELARDNAAIVFLSVTTLDEDLAAVLEPRTSRPKARLNAIAQLAKAGVPVGVNIAPVIPGLTDHELPAILKAAAEHGARMRGEGAIAGNIEQMFRIYARRWGLNRDEISLSTAHFRRPGDQLSLF